MRPKCIVVKLKKKKKRVCTVFTVRIILLRFHPNFRDKYTVKEYWHIIITLSFEKKKINAL